MVKEKEKIQLKPFNYKNIKVKVVGLPESSLLMEKMDERTKELMKQYFVRQKGKGKIDKGNDERTPEQIVESMIHHTLDGKVGFPARGFIKGMQRVAIDEGFTGTVIARKVRIFPPMIPIKYKKQVIQETMGKVGKFGGTPCPIIRPEFVDWSAELTIRFDADYIDTSNLLNLLNRAGTEAGLGSDRPGLGKGGCYGMYKVAGTK